MRNSVEEAGPSHNLGRSCTLDRNQDKAVILSEKSAAVLVRLRRSARQSSKLLLTHQPTAPAAEGWPRPGPPLLLHPPFLSLPLSTSTPVILAHRRGL